MIATYHNHSTFSDGKAKVDRVVERAIEMGIDVVGFSDHLTLHPSGTPPLWSMATDDLPRYVDAVQDARARHGDAINVRLGLELDWFDACEARLAEVIGRYPFDYIIGSVHFVEGFPVDGNPHRWEKLSQDDVDGLHEAYWNAIARMASSGLFDIAAHLDLPKKFGYLPRNEPEHAINRALDALASRDVVVELNTAGWHKVCADAYPSAAILRACRARDMTVTLSADAHDPDHLIRDFDRGLDRIRDAGFTSLARFTDRRRQLEPIVDG